MLAGGVFIQQCLGFRLSGIRIEFPEGVKVGVAEELLRFLASLAELRLPQPENLDAGLRHRTPLHRCDGSALPESYVLAGIASRNWVERIQQQRSLELVER